LHYFKGKKVLVIGGTGTIGQSLVKEILKYNPNVIRIFSRDEYKQFILQNELGLRKDVRFLIGDVRNYDRVLNAMEGIDYVFHTAAMKHVSMCEYNPYEAVLTNITGTYNVIKASITQNVEKVVFTSSDKAISPTNTYGATKLTGEKLIAAAQYSKGSAQTIFCSVRFGNVMGSRGSVIPLFVKQIKENKSITVTNVKMTRFMMTLNQATNLTMKAIQDSKGGETFVLKMPTIILGDLVTVVMGEICKKYNLNRNEIMIEEIGLRQGEKMFEELMTADESTLAWETPEMFIIPGLHQDIKNFSNGKRAEVGNYRSDHQVPLTMEELRKILQNENLIDRKEP
jgi:FlaA1/EpsC-like NDP-sugar epimerase